MSGVALWLLVHTRNHQKTAIGGNNLPEFPAKNAARHYAGVVKGAPMYKSYKECASCSLPYIDEVNGRDGRCDFCRNFIPSVVTEPAGNPRNELLAGGWNPSEPRIG
jgi:hypothetical protein